MNLVQSSTVLNLFRSDKLRIEINADQAMLAHRERNLVELVGNEIGHIDEVQGTGDMRLFQCARVPVVGERGTQDRRVVHGGVRIVGLAKRAGKLNFSWRIRIFFGRRFDERSAGACVESRARFLIRSCALAAGLTASGADRYESIQDLQFSDIQVPRMIQVEDASVVVQAQTMTVCVVVDEG